jgi:hypothetical protein
MSTRSILALQKGKRIRYCFLHWDGDKHGATLKEMTDAELQDLFDKMAPLDDNKPIYLDHLYTKAYWDTEIDYDRRIYEKESAKLMKTKAGKEKVQKEFASIYLNPQPTAYDPVLDDTKCDRTECGSHITKKADMSTIQDVTGGFYPFFACEYVWHINLDTNIITYFHEGKRKSTKRRVRKTPPKYDWSYYEKRLAEATPWRK